MEAPQRGVERRPPLFAIKIKLPAGKAAGKRNKRLVRLPNSISRCACCRRRRLRRRKPNRRLIERAAGSQRAGAKTRSTETHGRAPNRPPIH